VAIGHLLDAAGWPKNAQAYVTDLAPAVQLGMGGAAGTDTDLSGNGNDAAITVGGLSGAFELNVYIPMMARNLLESFTLLANVSRLFAQRCIVCHGLGADRHAFAGYTAMALRLGAHALAFDFRAHGRSGVFVSTLGADEVADLAAAVAWWRSQPGREHSPIVLVGVSMGGAVVLRAAGMVGAAGVLAESSYAELTAMIEAQTAPLGPCSGLAAAVVQAAARWQLGIDPKQVSPLQSLRALSPTIPVVLVHAGMDRVIPVAEGERLAAARADLELHVIAGAEHAGCLAVDPIALEQHLRTLLTAVADRR
jgi:alpha-beta hydrolase superfamily lysophospholipase